tara:strand:+ start:5140 stop:5505 length:366 start_codon:yes stop_codon:yes gene_type:complete
LPGAIPPTQASNFGATASSTEEAVKEDTTPDEDLRVLCNCYAYVQEVFPNLPHTSVILSNLESDGNVAVFYYPSSGVYHYAVVVDRRDGEIVIDETNFRRCKFSRRVISEEYPRLLGFYST